MSLFVYGILEHGFILPFEKQWKQVAKSTEFFFFLKDKVSYVEIITIE